MYVSEVAIGKRAKEPPFSKCLTSGSLPRFPTSITLFTLAIFYDLRVSHSHPNINKKYMS
jgi:hypothetical protein